jgi:DNA invertase Pin-like site-specific DNA recombinase
VKRTALYLRVSTADQHCENQLCDLQQLAEQRGWTVVRQYRDHGISGAKARRPALDLLLADARRGHFDVVAVWASDRMARSVRHFIELLDEFHHLGIEFVSYREQLDTAGPLGRAFIVIISVLAELERSLIIERVKAGMRRAKLEGIRIGRRPADVDRASVLRDRARGHSLTVIARAHRISRALVSKIIRQEKLAGHEGLSPSSPQATENKRPQTAA